MVLPDRNGKRALRGLLASSRQLLSEQGEMNGMPLARDLIDLIDHSADAPDATLDSYFDYLARELSPDPQAVLRCAQDYAAAPGPAPLMALTRAVEPPRQELLRRINRSSGGTAAVLRLRRALLRRLPKRPELRALEDDFLHLLSSWFNPGFLQMRRVDWNAPAQLLEKIIRHEAVHAIDGWDDLRRRLQPDRRCFAFFHPQLPDEPLIFVEVALLPEMPARIAPLIDKTEAPLPESKFRVATFYSISNCESGLRGVSLGNFLIKQVAEQLQRELPRIKTYCTLSPLPGFAAWLRSAPLLSGKALAAQRALAAAEPGSAAHDSALQTLAAAYLVRGAALPDGDPVARFHLDNGARLQRLNVQGNRSARGIAESFGLMVNYQYDLDRIESNHLRFRRGEVAHSRAVAALL